MRTGAPIIYTSADRCRDPRARGRDSHRRRYRSVTWVSRFARGMGVGRVTRVRSSASRATSHGPRTAATSRSIRLPRRSIVARGRSRRTGSARSKILRRPRPHARRALDVRRSRHGLPVERAPADTPRGLIFINRVDFDTGRPSQRRGRLRRESRALRPPSRSVAATTAALTICSSSPADNGTTRRRRPPTTRAEHVPVLWPAPPCGRAPTRHPRDLR